MCHQEHTTRRSSLSGSKKTSSSARSLPSCREDHIAKDRLGVVANQGLNDLFFVHMLGSRLQNSSPRGIRGAEKDKEKEFSTQMNLWTKVHQLSKTWSHRFLSAAKDKPMTYLFTVTIHPIHSLFPTVHSKNRGGRYESMAI